jgi:hypothetical protein
MISEKEGLHGGDNPFIRVLLGQAFELLSCFCLLFFLFMQIVLDFDKDDT